MSSPTLNMLADLIATLAEAEQYGYSYEAAYQSAVERLLEMDHGELLALSATMVALTATQMKPRSDIDLSYWIEAFSFEMAMGGADGERDS